MTEYIDHAAEAAEGIRTVPIQGNMPTDEVANWIALHQVQATLALVEQQRIANLIALGHKYYGNGEDADSTYANLLRPEIRIALGLEDA